VAAWICGSALAVQAQDSKSSAGAVFVIEAIEFEGNTRTPTAAAVHATGLRPGDTASIQGILSSADQLRQSQIFGKVRIHTRPGSAPGRIIVVFDVEESRPHFRFGMGYEDFSGWYLIPIQLDLDNLGGHGERFRISTRLGYRLAGLLAEYRHPIGNGRKTFLGATLRGENQDRIYYLDRTEIRHGIGRSGADLRLTHDINGSLSLEAWGSIEKVRADSSAHVYRTSESEGREQGEAIPFEGLPEAVRKDLRRGRLPRVGLALNLDARTGENLRCRGITGQARGEWVVPRSDPFALAQVDLRGYQPLRAGLQLATRLRYGIATSGAPFYERFYLGGLYTVRGYPSQSLSPPGGELSMAVLTIELRAPIIGAAGNPRLAGLVFADGGACWSSGAPTDENAAAGIGYGLRWRLPWIGRLGLDIAHPLSTGPVEEGFHVNLSLGWTF
jgi:outer membrane protein insertion porin family